LASRHSSATIIVTTETFGTATVKSRSHIPLWRTPRTRALLAVGVLAVLSAIVSFAARVFTEALWFSEVGHGDVYWTTVRWKLLVTSITLLGPTCLALVNLMLVARRTRSANRALHVAAAIACGLLSYQLRPSGGWELLALWSNRTDFGVDDPLFHRDVSFFVFTLPLCQQLARWLLEVLLLTTAATVSAYALEGKLREAREHLLGIGTVALLVVAWRLRLDQFALALPHPGSVVPGASYTVIHVRLPLLRASVLLALAAAGICAFAVRHPVRVSRLGIVAGCAAVAAALAGALPTLVQHFDVAPQALARERPSVQASSAATRRAFALDQVDVRPRNGDGELSKQALKDERATLENIPLWDASVLRPAMNETQSIGGYYSFPGTTTDRYGSQLLTVAPRRLDLRNLEPASLTWANTHFAYTHGYGVVAIRGGDADRDRYPRFLQKDFDGTALGLTEPRIYFGEPSPLDPPYVVLGSGRAEVEQPAPGSQPPDYHYTGEGGVQLSNPLRRVAFAIRFQDFELALSETVKSHSRIAFRRDPRERVETLAPFLDWEKRPQTVVADGRVQFLFHGYTTSRHYPYSKPVGRVNYLRASVLGVVDAFDGHVTLYATDTSDPILRAWSGVHPGLFANAETLPASVRTHLRYPRRLFTAQAQVYETYHAGDATAFWNGTDAWRRASELAGPAEDAGEIHFPTSGAEQISRPDYMLVRLPGDREQRMQLTMAFTPQGRENLVGYLAGTVDASLKPRLTLLSLPRDRLTTGPTQATRQILATPGVDHTLQILNRESRDLGKASINRTILGTPRIVPLGDALVHVQPVYVTAGGSGFPRLQLVTAYANGRVGYGPDLRRALAGVVRAGS
jgi:uncharacterized membrane protein (UPF0182 family)